MIFPYRLDNSEMDSLIAIGECLLHNEETFDYRMPNERM